MADDTEAGGSARRPTPAAAEEDIVTRLKDEVRALQVELDRCWEGLRSEDTDKVRSILDDGSGHLSAEKLLNLFGIVRDTEAAASPYAADESARVVELPPTESDAPPSLVAPTPSVPRAAGASSKGKEPAPMERRGYVPRTTARPDPEEGVTVDDVSSEAANLALQAAQLKSLLRDEKAAAAALGNEQTTEALSRIMNQVDEVYAHVFQGFSGPDAGPSRDAASAAGSESAEKSAVWHDADVLADHLRQLELSIRAYRARVAENASAADSNAGKKKKKKKKKKKAKATTDGDDEGEGDDGTSSVRTHSTVADGCGNGDEGKTTANGDVDGENASNAKKKKRKKRKKKRSGGGGEVDVPEMDKARQELRQFWNRLSSRERQTLLRIDAEDIMKMVKAEHRHVCSCSVCGRKRYVIDREVERLFDLYCEELLARGEGEELCNADLLLEHDEHFEYEYDGVDYIEEFELERWRRKVQQTYRRLELDFGRHLIFRNRLIQMDDDLLAPGGGMPLIDELEWFASLDHSPTLLHQHEKSARQGRRARAMYDDDAGPDGLPHTSDVAANLEAAARQRRPDYNDDEYEYDDYAGADEDDMYYDDEDDIGESDELDEEDIDDEEDLDFQEMQRAAEARRMFQIFAARLFKERIVTAFREAQALEKQRQLIEEEEQEEQARRQQEMKKKQREKERIAKQEQAREKQLREQEDKRKREEEEKQRQEEERARKRKEALLEQQQQQQADESSSDSESDDEHVRALATAAAARQRNRTKPEAPVPPPQHKKPATEVSPTRPSNIVSMSSANAPSPHRRAGHSSRHGSRLREMNGTETMRHPPGSHATKAPRHAGVANSQNVRSNAAAAVAAPPRRGHPATAAMSAATMPAAKKSSPPQAAVEHPASQPPAPMRTHLPPPKTTQSIPVAPQTAATSLPAAGMAFPGAAKPIGTAQNPFPGTGVAGGNGSWSNGMGAAPPPMPAMNGSASLWDPPRANPSYAAPVWGNAPTTASATTTTPAAVGGSGTGAPAGASGAPYARGTGFIDPHPFADTQPFGSFPSAFGAHPHPQQQQPAPAAHDHFAATTTGAPAADSTPAPAFGSFSLFGGPTLFGSPLANPSTGVPTYPSRHQ